MKAAWAALVAGLALAGAAGAQQANTQSLFIGTIVDVGAMGYDDYTVVTCRGFPTCTGSYVSTTRYENCSNYYTVSGDITITGLELSRSGPLQGTLVVGSYDNLRLAGGICGPSSAPHPETHTYTGTWSLAAGIGTLNLMENSSHGAIMNFKADVTAPPPVFPMTVRAQIGPQTSTASADIRFRTEDVGRNGSVYVFASAPAERVVNGLAATAVSTGFAKSVTKADPVPCVLAQVNTSGQLVALSVAQLQAFVTGAFAAQGAAVSILNNTPTPAIAGATFYVGYGSSAGAMIDNGIFRNAVLVPGDGACPLLPYQTALWWNPAESGWGLNLNHQGNKIFATLFTYDAGRAPLWLVMSGGEIQPDGRTFTGDLFRTTGPVFNANPFTPLGPGNVTRVGAMTVSFTEANAGTLHYTVNGIEVQKTVQRQVFGARAANCLPTADSRAASTNYQDLWWNPAESGWGVNITHQDQTLFATLFTYDPAGRDLWLVMPGGTRQGDGSYLGDLYRTTGPPFNSLPFEPIGASDLTIVGSMRFRFTDGNTGTLTYTYAGANVTKSITRQVFSTPLSACN